MPGTAVAIALASVLTQLAFLDWTVIHPANCEYWIQQWMLGLAL